MRCDTLRLGCLNVTAFPFGLLPRFGFRPQPLLLFLIPPCLLRDALRLGCLSGTAFPFGLLPSFVLRPQPLPLFLIPPCLLRDALRLGCLSGTAFPFGLLPRFGFRPQPLLLFLIPPCLLRDALCLGCLSGTAFRQRHPGLLQALDDVPAELLDPFCDRAFREAAMPKFLPVEILSASDNAEQRILPP